MSWWAYMGILLVFVVITEPLAAMITGKSVVLDWIDAYRSSRKR